VVNQRRLCMAGAKVITKFSWAVVSSARGPRAVRTAAMAASGEIPAATRQHAATVPLRPSPAMLVTTTASPRSVAARHHRARSMASAISGCALVGDGETVVGEPGGLGPGAEVGYARPVELGFGQQA
jgi:hypothetical protein